MKKMILRFAAAVILAALCLEMSAQVPAFREKGYKGNVGIQGLYLYVPGITTSHGYMFNGVHYLGGGLSVAVTPSSDPTIVPAAFLEYQAYFLKRNSTPVAGVKLQGMAELSDRPYYLAGLIPTFGWSWGIGTQKQFGIMPYLGIGAFYEITRSKMHDSFTALMLPILGVVFEF